MRDSLDVSCYALLLFDVVWFLGGSAHHHWRIVEEVMVRYLDSIVYGAVVNYYNSIDN